MRYDEADFKYFWINWRDFKVFLLHLAQHIVLLHIVDLPGVDLSFQGVLKELAADVKQQGAGGPLLQGAAQGGLVVVAGGRNAITQNHTHQQTWQIKSNNSLMVANINLSQCFLFTTQLNHVGKQKKAQWKADEENVESSVRSQAMRRAARKR